MRFFGSAAAFGLVAFLSMTTLALAEKTRAQCEPDCEDALHSCAEQVVTYCSQRETDYNGCYRGAREKCQIGGVKSNDVYGKCIKRCMSEQ